MSEIPKKSLLKTEGEKKQIINIQGFNDEDENNSDNENNGDNNERNIEQDTEKSTKSVRFKIEGAEIKPGQGSPDKNPTTTIKKKITVDKSEGEVLKIPSRNREGPSGLELMTPEEAENDLNSRLSTILPETEKPKTQSSQPKVTVKPPVITENNKYVKRSLDITSYTITIKKTVFQHDFIKIKTEEITKINPEEKFKFKNKIGVDISNQKKDFVVNAGIDETSRISSIPSTSTFVPLKDLPSTIETTKTPVEKRYKLEVKKPIKSLVIFKNLQGFEELTQ